MLVIFVAVTCALVTSLLVVRAPWPPGVFPKYLAIAAAAGAARQGDVSPLYLALTSMMLPAGSAILWLQCAFHAATAALIGLAASRLASWRAGLAAAALAGLHVPLAVAAGTHEPESVLQLMLAIAMLAGVAARRSTTTTARLVTTALVAGAAIGLATSCRPQHILLAPAWAAWIAMAQPRGRRLLPAAAVLAGAVVACAPFVVRSHAGGASTMNPAVVLYEGNWPGAVGITRYAPPLVIELERLHPEQFDYGHVAYRRIASHAVGHEVSAPEANRWWFGLMVEGMRHDPGAALRRLASKTLHAVAPAEFHDLRVMEDLSRRGRRLLPWGFFALLVGIPLVAFANRREIAGLAGPLAIAALAIAVQVAFYDSSRQRLPLATALCLIVPVVASGWRSWRIKPALATALALAVALLVAFLGGRAAVLDQAGWDAVSGAPRASLGESLASILDGRALRPGAEREQARVFEASVALVLERGVVSREFQQMEGLDLDLTSDDRTVGVPEYWLARVEKDPERRRTLALRALLIRPGDPRIAALAGCAGDHASDRPAGVDPASWSWALAQECGDAQARDTLREDFADLDPE